MHVFKAGWPQQTCTKYCTPSWNISYFPSSSLLPVSRYPVWEGHGRMVLKRILNVLVCPKKRMHRSGTDGDGESRLTQVHLEGSPGRITQVHLEGSPGRITQVHLEGSPGRITQVHLEGSPGRITQVHLEGWSYKKDGYRQWNVRQFLQSA